MKKKTVAKKQSYKKTALLFIVLILLIIGFSCYKKGAYISSAKVNKVTQVCPDLPKITDTIARSVDHANKLKISQMYEQKMWSYSWKPTSDGPFRSYETSLPLHIDYFGQKVTITDKSFKEKALNKIVEAGYVPNAFNTIPLRKRYPIEYTVARYGFTKDDTYLVVKVESADEFMDGDIDKSGPEVSSRIEVLCGKPNKENDEMYDGIVKNSPELKSDAMLSIWEMKDNVAQVDKSTYPGGFGIAQYWVHAHDTFKKIYEGQDGIMCNLVEKTGLGKGLRCYDDVTKAEREAK